MHVRAATADDEPEVVEELLRPAYRESEALDPEYHDLDEAYLADADCARWLEDDDRALFVAEADGRLVGYVSGGVRDPPPLYARGPELGVDGLYVRESHRRRGVATALLDRIEAWGAERGCDHVAVSVHVENRAARELYERTFERTYLRYRRRIE